MQKYLFILLSVFLFLSACQDDNDNPEPTPQPNGLITVEAVQVRLLQEEDNNNLVTAIDEQPDGSYMITFENGEQVLVQAGIISSVNRDLTNWKLTLTYANLATQETNLLGDVLPIDPSDIKLDPFSSAPLSALATLEMPVPGKFSIRVLGKGNNGIAIDNDFERVSTQHRIPVLGLYQDYANQVEFIFKDPNGNVRLSKIMEVQTQLVGFLPEVNVVTNNLDPNDQTLTIMASMNAAFDHQGEMRWVYAGDTKSFYQKLANGNILVSGREGVVYHSKYFYEATMLGEIVRRYEVPNEMHHEVRELPNGNFLVAGNTTQVDFGGEGGLEEDLLLVIDRNTEAVIKAWDMNVILDNQRLRLPGERIDDWLHMNAAYFDETDNSVVISGRAQSAIVKMDYDSGDIKWILGAHPEWSVDFQQYLLTPVDANGQPIDSADVVEGDFWPYGQHAPMRMPNGNILVYDNGRYRNFYNDQTVAQPSYSRAVEYAIDEQNMTIQKVWEFNNNKQYYTPIQGDVDFFPENNHRMIGYMNASQEGLPRVIELDESNNIVFEAFVIDAPNYYRFSRVNLYEGIQEEPLQ